MAEINWNDGQLITLTPGDTATCKGNLNDGQLYGLFFYNSAGNDAGATVTVVASNSLTATVEVPGTTAKQGLAAICFVSGSDTNSVAASIFGSQPGIEVQAFICSVKMPLNISGIQNLPLPQNGAAQRFQKFTRYFTVPASHPYGLQLRSDINQFMTVQFTTQRAVVNVVNEVVDPEINLVKLGSAEKQVTVRSTPRQLLSWTITGNGSQTLFVNSDSVQNSQGASISMQSLANQLAAVA
jgi:hypothetical protein